LSHRAYVVFLNIEQSGFTLPASAAV